MSNPRVVGWSIQPIVVNDTGDHLVPVSVSPVQVNDDQWDAFDPSDIREKLLASVKQQLDIVSPPTQP